MANNKTPYTKELERIKDRERHFLKKHRQRDTASIDTVLAGKVKPGTKDQLSFTFNDSFKIMLFSGTEGIEFTINKGSREARWEDKLNHAEIFRDSDSIRALSNSSIIDNALNIYGAAATGITMGILGKADVAMFVTQLIRNIYQLALDFGYTYDSDEEKYFILLLIQGGISYGEMMWEINSKVNDFIHNAKIPKGTSVDNQIDITSDALAHELLYMKFIQKIPLIGAIGGAINAYFMKLILEYADIMYKKRMLEDNSPSLNSDRYNPVHIVK